MKLTLHFKTWQQAHAFLSERADSLQQKIRSGTSDANASIGYAVVTRRLRDSQEDILEQIAIIEAMPADQCDGTVFVVEV